MKIIRDAESVRYAVLRRLAPAIRHGMVGKLHPIGLMSDAMARRIQSAPDLGQALEGLVKINELSRAALAACSELVSWFAPEEGGVVSLQQGVDECLALLGAEWGMRGHTLDRGTDTGPDRVDRAAARQVLAAALLAVMDAEPRPIDLQLRMVPAGAGGKAPPSSAALELAWTRSSRSPMLAPDEIYRTITWEDVELLAGAEGVELQRKDQSLRLCFDILSD